jgi:N6-L-threonylcarbamoyladenine synthase
MKNNKSLILGIETSCDETALAIMHGFELIHQITATQWIHEEYGGVVPEYASREHEKLLPAILDEILNKTAIELSEFDGIAVTRGPGLAGSLLVGLSFAKGLAVALDIPLYGINHIEGHIFANFIGQELLPTPFLCLLVSGGHTQIVHVKSMEDFSLIGTSRDDAAGEAFDKVARLLGIGYPGGPLIDKLSQSGNAKFHHFPRTNFKEGYDFSFSGLKTSVMYYVKDKSPEFINENLADIAASFQEAVVDALVGHAIKAATDLKLNRIVLAGGVAANTRLREKISTKSKTLHIKVYQPELHYCTDNAAMIAYLGYWKHLKKDASSLAMKAIPNLKLSFRN